MCLVVPVIIAFFIILAAQEEVFLEKLPVKNSAVVGIKTF